MTSKVEPKALLPALTGLRFFAAAAVVVYHFGLGVAQKAEIPLLLDIARTGYLGVGLFFVLSGFVLTYSSRDAAVSSGPRAFYQARFARVFPLHGVAWLLAALFYVPNVLHEGGSSAVLKLVLLAPVTLFLLQAWTPFSALSWNGPAWSLSVEAFFYSLFPRLAKSEGRRSLPWLWAAAVVIALVALCVAWWVPGKTQLLGTTVSLSTLVDRTAGFHPLLRLPEFLFGVELAKRLTGPRSAISANAGWVSLGLLVWFFGCVMLGSRVFEARFLAQALLVPVFGWVIWRLATTVGFWVRFLSARPLRWLGEVSFAIYILQDPMWEMASSMHHGLFPADRHPGWAGLALFSVLLLAVSALAHHAIERPMQAWLRPKRVVSNEKPTKPGPGDLVSGVEAVVTAPESRQF